MRFLLALRYDSAMFKLELASCTRARRSGGIDGPTCLAILFASLIAVGCATQPNAYASVGSASSQESDTHAPDAAVAEPAASESSAPSPAPARGAPSVPSTAAEKPEVESAATAGGQDKALSNTIGGLPQGALQAEPATPAISQRDGLLWPEGYYPGDPLPLHTVYLTFDDGPSDFTVQILDILKEEGIHATFL